MVPRLHPVAITTRLIARPLEVAIAGPTGDPGVRLGLRPEGPVPLTIPLRPMLLRVAVGKWQTRYEAIAIRRLQVVT